MNIWIDSYKEKGYQPIPSVYLSDKDYGRGLQCFVPVCTDIVPIDSGAQLIYLARRKSKSMTGWWWIGGRMMPHETKEEAAVRNFKRETKLEIPTSRLTLVGVFDYQWKNRSQKPQEIGCHMVAYTFTVEIEPQEITFISDNLDTEEYERVGLYAFDREFLVKKRVFPAIIDLYDYLFSR